MLDIGSGWGALVLHLAGVRGCDVTGISPAPRQREFVEKRARQRGLSSRVRIVTSPFEEAADLPRGIDAVTVLGSVVHMPDLPAVFAKARGLLRRGGRMYVSETCFRNRALRARFDRVEGTDFVREASSGHCPSWSPPRRTPGSRWRRPSTSPGTTTGPSSSGPRTCGPTPRP
ncbi:hypothetical protein GCM10023175_40690 [Pseudonocardia xishanensis]|uniref:Methyltransferase type 11 domain-containing protein n=1 Tax=Pseudonocardia xishanensis TaxID=630995 RepID=A0ABP8RWE3_9PSEU